MIGLSDTIFCGAVTVGLGLNSSSATQVRAGEGVVRHSGGDEVPSPSKLMARSGNNFSATLNASRASLSRWEQEACQTEVQILRAEVNAP